MNGSLRLGRGELAATVADAGTILPIAAALVLVNGVDPVAVFALTGALFVATGFLYRAPVPVQPIKAAAAIAIAVHASPEVIAAAGLVLGGVLVLIAVTRAASWLARIFPKPVIRGNQLGVGLLLAITAAGMAGRVGRGGLVAAALMALGLAMGAGRRIPVGLALVGGGVAWTLLTDGVRGGLGLHPALPVPHVPSTAAMATALTLLVIPQLPLTLSNAIVGIDDLSHELLGPRAARVTPTRLSLSSGLANVAVGLLGGMPLCHGSSGLTAYHRMGARTGGTDLVIGGVLIGIGLVVGTSAPVLIALVPVPVLAALLAYTGARHAWLVTDQRRWDLAIALAMGVTGALTRNLAWAMAVGLPTSYLVAALRRSSRRTKVDDDGRGTSGHERLTTIG